MGRVIVAGGGIVGAGIVRDLTLRGVDVTLIERQVPAAGATGRCHGLLHSGARYAVRDLKAAAECATEGPILKRMAPHCIEDTGGFSLAVTEKDAEYGDLLLPACQGAGVAIEEIDASESPNPEALRCFRTDDAAVDPFLLTLSNLYDARQNGAEIICGRAVVSLSDGIVRLDDGQSLKADVIINATGHECAGLLRQSGMDAPAVQPDKGTILVTERRVCHAVISHMRMPSDGDIIVPGHSTSLIGTTSSRSDDSVSTRDEYRRLMREAVALLPAMEGVRIIRAFSGIRPLLGTGEGRELSRDFCISESGGVLTVAGGKLTTYRLIAERASDAVMKVMGERGSCRTMTTKLPDIRQDSADGIECRCESAGKRIVEMDFLRGMDLSKYNRLGFGTCQGLRCSKHAPSQESFLEERWKGVRPVLDESQLRQAYVTWAAWRTSKGEKREI